MLQNYHDGSQCTGRRLGKSRPLTIYLVAARMDHFIAESISNNGVCWHMDVNRTHQYRRKGPAENTEPIAIAWRQPCGPKNSSLHKKKKCQDPFTVAGNQYREHSCLAIKWLLICKAGPSSLSAAHGLRAASSRLG